MSTIPPSDQCTDEMDASPTGGAPGRAIAASTAAVQSPSSGCRTTSTLNPGPERGSSIPARRGMIVLQQQHARAGRHRQRLRRRGDAVAHRGNQRDVAGIGIDQPRRRTTRPLVLTGGEVGIDRPGPALARDADTPRLLHGDRQRAPGGSVEKQISRGISKSARCDGSMPMPLPPAWPLLGACAAIIASPMRMRRAPRPSAPTLCAVTRALQAVGTIRRRACRDRRALRCGRVAQAWHVARR